MRSYCVCFLVLALLSFSATAQIRITDLAGREVVLEQPAQKVILGEGRFLAILGVLGVEQPLQRVAGMMDEFRRFDPTGFAAYQTAFPGIDKVPTFGQTDEQSVSVEQAILAQPDVAIFGLAGHGPGARSKHIVDRLEDAGIKVVFIDFRQHPLRNTVPSVEVVGAVLGLPERATVFAQRYQRELAEVTERLTASPPKSCPRVLLDVRADATQPCCFSIAEGMFADMIEAAGGCNVAQGLLPGSVGEVSLEHVIASGPEVYIGTAIGAPSPDAKRINDRIVLGSGSNQDMALASLRRVLERPGVSTLPAVLNARAHGLWHHFYNSPLNIYALQKIAQWLHPELFNDLQPEQLLNDLLSGFAPINLDGVYAISLEQ